LTQRRTAFLRLFTSSSSNHPLPQAALHHTDSQSCAAPPRRQQSHYDSCLSPPPSFSMSALAFTPAVPPDRSSIFPTVTAQHPSSRLLCFLLRSRLRRRPTLSSTAKSFSTTSACSSSGGRRVRRRVRDAAARESTWTHSVQQYQHLTIDQSAERSYVVFQGEGDILGGGWIWWNKKEEGEGPCEGGTG
jgi:hypothetical protein